jgi:hypothetical protein
MARETRITYIFLIALIAALWAAPALAQQPTKSPTPNQKNDKKPKKFSGPNFSGTWVLDESRSRDIEANVFKLKPPPVDPKVKITNILVIEQKDAEFKTTVKRRTENFDDAGKPVNTSETIQSVSVYFLDQRGEKNKFGTDKLYDSVTGQKDRDITVVITADAKYRRYNTLTFTMSKDGRELVFSNDGYKLEPDYTTGSTFASPTALRSKKVYIKVQ